MYVPLRDAGHYPNRTSLDSEVDGSVIRIGRRQARESTFALKAQSSEFLRPVSSRLTDTPAVMVIGPRQFGKTTLARELVDGERPYLTLDNQTTHPSRPN
jgi:polynucleotide 5'-kinase involved in rRNA processing